MDIKRLKIILILVLLVSITTTSTLCIFTKYVEKTGTIQTKELSTVFLNNNDFLAKVQVLDSSITSIDKTTDLTRVTTTPQVTLTDANIVSTDSSNVPTYLWIESGTIYYYTAAVTIDINNN